MATTAAVAPSLAIASSPLAAARGATPPAVTLSATRTAVAAVAAVAAPVAHIL